MAELCKRSGSSWWQQPGKQSKPATPLSAFSPGTEKRGKPGAAAAPGVLQLVATLLFQTFLLVTLPPLTLLLVTLLLVTLAS